MPTALQSTLNPILLSGDFKKFKVCFLNFLNEQINLKRNNSDAGMSHKQNFSCVRRISA